MKEIKRGKNEEVSTIPKSLAALKRLRVEGRGLFTSEGILFNNGLWARDSVICSLDLLASQPDIARDVIKTLPEFQGTKFAKLSEEEPGRIHDEYRNFRDWQAPAALKYPAQYLLSPLWGGNFQEYTTYFASDTTPLFIKLVSEYAEKIDPSVLDSTVMRKGEEIRVKDSVYEAASWIMKNINSDGLVEVPRHNIFGYFSQTWRDGHTSNPREEGSLPNVIDPEIYLDVQFLSVEALNRAAKIFEDEDPELSEEWRRAAREMKHKTIDKFWMEDQQFFAIGIDKDPKTGEDRLIKTIQSNPGWMLNTDFFDDLPDQERQKYLKGIVERLFSTEFLTDAGIRARSTVHIDDSSYADYHGSWVSWPVDSYMFAKGLRRQGFGQLAEQIENRILNVVNMAGVSYEFFIIDKNGRVLLDPVNAKKPQEGALELAMQMVPEYSIAWTNSAVAAIKVDNGSKKDIGADLIWTTTAVASIKKDRAKKGRDSVGETTDFETEILSKIKRAPLYKTVKELKENRHDQPKIHLNQQKGILFSVIDILPQVGKQLMAVNSRKLRRR